MASPQADDHHLVEASKAGDRQAFQLLYKRYKRRVFAVAYGFLKNDEDALDVVQEAFIKAYRHLPKFEGQSTFYTWIYRIARNLCIDHLRRSSRKRDSELDEKNATHQGHIDPALLAKLGDPLRAVRNKEIREAVFSTLDELSDNHRAVIIMREFQGLSYADMAKAMNCSRGTIMSRLFHARKNLQKLLVARLDLDADKIDGEATSPDVSSPEVATT